MCKTGNFGKLNCRACKGICRALQISYFENNEIMKNVKAIIFDLDNTIYPASSISEVLFENLFDLIERDGRYSGDFTDVKDAITRRPFQRVVEDFRFNGELTENSIKLLSDLVYSGPIQPFESFDLVRKLDCKKFLATTGFTKLQWSKVKSLNLNETFDEVYIVDPQISDETKKDIFSRIIDTYHFLPEEVLVLGDDLNSEIKAGKELGLRSVIFDFDRRHNHVQGEEVVNNYIQFMEII